MFTRRNSRCLVTLLMLLFWGVAVNHCWLEACLASESSPIHHSCADSHQHGVLCESAHVVQQTPQFSVKLGKHIFDCRNLIPLLLSSLFPNQSQEVAIYHDTALTSFVHWNLVFQLLAAPNAPPQLRLS